MTTTSVYAAYFRLLEEARAPPSRAPHVPESSNPGHHLARGQREAATSSVS